MDAMINETKINILLSDQPLDIKVALEAVNDGSAGAVDIFIGTVRNKTQERTVVRLEYEAYDSMAVKEMEKLAEETSGKWPVAKIAIHHRKGTLYIGDIAVIIAVSTPHRQEAFEACKYTIDSLKQRVPIWKKEIFEDGETWVAAHP
ncbi:molybdenum cofactor biosynthesis protein MoaE [Catalinimonas niigatensis]|uniref:molybdenum cofactor biosynthesis protein MoaE n=1 Tax=Catalinimonas niigatensis TaxID=1397264 RepID=UPI002665D491|nr:molybdenum cofactor biosynthesis protein MoaE [Catalinimonas niigatensis]WPP52814.1 molybdenum cofactor biosynthesis protein MoaE [Catalinimonas niigatensis]